MPELDSVQVERLNELFIRWIQSEVLIAPLELQSETDYTGKSLMPLFRYFVSTLGKNFLHVRGNGGDPSLPLTVDGLQYYSDIEIVAGIHRYLSVEVKILRANDPTGALSKSIGQAFMYKSLGAASSHILLIDLRAQARPSSNIQIEKIRSQLEDVGICLHWFVRSNQSSMIIRD